MFDTIWSWLVHPDTYQMTWWVLICVGWFGIATELRLKRIEAKLDAHIAGQTKPLP